MTALKQPEGWERLSQKGSPIKSQWANSALERAKITVPGNSMQVEESCSHEEKPAKCGGLGRVMRLDGTRPRDVRVG